MYSISLIKPQAGRAWIQQTWHAILASTGVQAPTWQQNHWYEEVNMSGTERKELTFRAIKTFRELGEKLWQVSMVELMEETLSLFQKEMDYTVLLLLVHRREEDRMLWEQRLRVLFARLDPSLRPRYAGVKPRTPTPALGVNMQTHNVGDAPLLQKSGLPTVKEEPLEHATLCFNNPGPQLTGPFAQHSVAQSTCVVKEEPMDMM